MLNKLTITKRSELRKWLLDYSQIEKECWIKYVIKTNSSVLSYLDIVEEALCFGWIDSVKKKDESGINYQRISPRRKGSNWTELNKERVRRLEKLGLMTDFGRKVLPNMSVESFVIDDEILERLKNDIKVYQNFMSFPELYRRIRIDTIQQVRKDKELYQRRLEKFIENTKKSVMFGTWHDDNRLI